MEDDKSKCNDFMTQKYGGPIRVDDMMFMCLSYYSETQNTIQLKEKMTYMMSMVLFSELNFILIFLSGWYNCSDHIMDTSFIE